MKTLEQKLNELTKSDLYPMHMPGHKRRAFPPESESSVEQESVTTALSCAASIDITEIDGFDNLHAPEGVLADEMAYAAQFYGTRKTYFLVNGSTVGLLAAISAAVPFGGKILIERSCHIAVYHAAVLRRLRVEYIDAQRTFSKRGVTRSGEELFAGREGKIVWENSPDAIVITSPTYEGLKKDVFGYARFAAKQGAVLIVDEAHGAHFSRHSCFPKSAISEGADIVIQSTHKTLPCLTQTALLHNVSGRVPAEKIERFLDIYETSSPSYLLVTSITKTIHAMAEQTGGSQGYFDPYVQNLKDLRTALSGMKTLHLVGGKEAVIEKEEEGMIPGAREYMRLDPGKIVIATRDAGMAAPELYNLMRKKYAIQPEMKTLSTVLFMTSVGDPEEGHVRLAEALLEIDEELTRAARKRQSQNEEAAAEKADKAAETAETEAANVAGEKEGTAKTLPEPVLPIAEAYETEAEWIPLVEAAGRISADFIIVYPPDSPVIVPGERFSEAICRNIPRLQRAGLSLTGIRDGRVKVALRMISRYDNSE